MTQPVRNADSHAHREPEGKNPCPAIEVRLVPARAAFKFVANWMILMALGSVPGVVIVLFALGVRHAL